MTEVVVLEACRSAIGKRKGSLKNVESPDLLGDVLCGLFDRTGVDPLVVGEVIGGCVNQVGQQSGNIIRNAWLGAGLPIDVGCSTVHSQCGSSQQATTLAYAAVASGLVDVAVGAGVESMNQIPIFASSRPELGTGRNARYRRHYEVTTQFESADRLAEHWGLHREDLDQYGLLSQQRAAAAVEQGRFASQIVAIDAPVHDDAGAVVGTKAFAMDEALRDSTIESLAKLDPNVKDRPGGGHHTPGTSAPISDGASALLLATSAKASELGLTPRARIVDAVLVGVDPVAMLTGPISATAALLRRNSLNIDAIDVFEINESFAAIVLSWQKETGADLDRINPNGGAIAFGHPLGASGGILLTKTLYELERSGGRYGLVSMSGGGGLGIGTLIERI
jgi:acetyl-CoA C-acetyltransferase